MVGSEIDVEVRWLRDSDMPVVQAIEYETFLCRPWQEDDFQAALAGTGFGLVALVRSRIRGFLIADKNPSNYHLTNIAVQQGQQGRGIGTMLIKQIKAGLAANRAHILADVCETNVRACNFFKANGFQAIKVYPEIELDADNIKRDVIRMAYRLPKKAQSR